MRVIKIWKITFNCKSERDRIAFHHECDAVFNWQCVASAYCQYYNRTYERRTYQTCVLDALNNIEEKFKTTRRKWERFTNSELWKAVRETRELARNNLY